MKIKNTYLLKMYNTLEMVYMQNAAITPPTIISDSQTIISKYTMDDIGMINDVFINNIQLNTEDFSLVAFFARYMMSLNDSMIIDNRWQEFDHDDEEIIKYSNDAYKLIMNNKMTDEYMTEFMVTLKLRY